MESLSSIDESATVCLEWKNVSVYANKSRSIFSRSTDKNKKVILKNISGKVTGGLLAIMGASGAGKTTLLNALSGWISSKFSLSGEILVDHEVVNMKNISSYVQQTDVFYEYLTVYEHMIFQARLRGLNSELSPKKISEDVNSLIDHFQLTRSSSNIIGTYGSNKKGISIGERRRLSIITELLGRPKILFCDEPTSGLDLFSAEITVNALKKCCSLGCTVICSIHQPTFYIYQCFDNLLLLSNCQNVYTGPISEALNHFKRAGLECPQNFNPPDYFIKEIAIIPEKELECVNRIKKLIDIQNHTSDSSTISSSCKENRALEKQNSYNTSIWNQFSTIAERDFILCLRDYKTIIFRFLQNIVFSLLLGFLYTSIPYNNVWLFSNAGVVLFLIAAISYSVVVSVVYTFPLHLDVFRREHRAGLYRTSLFLFSKWIAEIPTFSFVILIDLLIVYNMSALNPDTKAFYLMYLIFWFSIQGSLCFAFLLSVIAKDLMMAITLGGPISILLCIVGGFFISEYEMMWAVRWVKYISWVRYTYEAALIVHMDYRPMRCTGLCFAKSLDITKVSLLVGVDFKNYKNDFIGMILLPVGYMLLACLILTVKTYYWER